MKILAKSILDEKEIENHRDIPTDGIEFLLLEEDFENYEKTKEILVREAEEWSLIGLEAPDSTSKYAIDPLSSNKDLRDFSQDFLIKFINLSNYVNERTGKVAYLQFQYLFDNKFSENGIPGRIDRNVQLEKIKENYDLLNSHSSVQLQIENVIPIDPSYSDGTLRYCYNTIRPEDFVKISAPMALDICHLAQTFYTWSQAQQESDKWFSLILNDKDSKEREVYIQMTEDDLEIAKRIREGDLKSNITSELINVINEHAPIIGSLQFANSKVGFGDTDDDAGYAGRGGMIDLQRIFKEAIIPQNIPYVIPEYNEEDYYNPINQRDAVGLVRRLTN